MRAPRQAQVLVVGAGPAGAVAAAALAQAGIGVLLAGDDDSGGDRYDVLLSGPALRGLASLGVPALAPARPVEVLELRFGRAPGREITDSGAAVCDRGQLRRALRRVAAEAGAERIAGTVTSLTRGADGYRAVIEAAGAATEVTAPHAVIAAGAAVRGGLVPDSEPHAAGVACVQRFTGADLGARTILALDAPATTDPDERPACAWALPGDGGGVTVGTTAVGDPPAAPAALLAAALRTLARGDPRLAGLRPAGPLISGPLNTGFTPSRVARAEALLVGDAAGLVNPFTGEGLSYAVQSGLLAARSIAANRSNPDAARRRYARRLAATFVGYFETARHAARRYHLAWRVLAAGADNDHPFFTKGRRAILLPEGFSGLTAVERMDLSDPDTVLIAPFLAACDEVAITTVRREWPFLARLVIAGESLAHHRLRPAVPFFAALLAAGRKPDITRATPAAAIELALLGALAVLGPAPPPAAGRGVDWAVTATVLAGDFLLAQASRLVADSAPEVSWSFADWLAELTALRAARLDPRSGTSAGAVYASLLEFPARIGAQLGGAPPPVAQALRDFGHHCGHAFLHAEDVLVLRGERTRLDTTLAVMLQGRFSGIPDSLDGQPAAALAADPRLRSRALAAATAACGGAREQALQALAAVPDPAAARMLRAFIETVAAPAADR